MTQNLVLHLLHCNKILKNECNDRIRSYPHITLCLRCWKSCLQYNIDVMQRNARLCVIMWTNLCSYTVLDIIKFTYYHCTSIEHSVHCEWSTLYFKIWMYYTVFRLSSKYYAITHKCKGNSHNTVQSSTIVLLRSTVDYHLVKV